MESIEENKEHDDSQEKKKGKGKGKGKGKRSVPAKDKGFEKDSNKRDSTPKKKTKKKSRCDFDSRLLSMSLRSFSYLFVL